MTSPNYLPSVPYILSRVKILLLSNRERRRAGRHSDSRSICPNLVEDPNDALREWASAIMQMFVRPRQYIQEKANRFFGRKWLGVMSSGGDAAGKGPTGLIMPADF